MTASLTFPFVFILGIGHSGTTLLGRMLGAHSAALCVGEILRLEQAAADPEKKCSCGASFRACAFWQELSAHLPKEVMRDYKKWSPELFEDILARQGKQMLVDTSKSRAFRLISKWERRSARYILMIRDPRGVMRSSLRRGKDLTTLLGTHLKWIERYLDFARKQPDRCTTTFYEDLIAAPEMQLRRVCDFLSLPFESDMLGPNAQLQHLIRASGSPYLKGTNDLRQDERWRDELTPEQIREISRVLREVPIYRERYQLA